MKKGFKSGKGVSNLVKEVVERNLLHKKDSCPESLFRRVKKVFGGASYWSGDEIKTPLSVNKSVKWIDFVNLLETLRKHNYLFISDQKTEASSPKKKQRFNYVHHSGEIDGVTEEETATVDGHEASSGLNKKLLQKNVELHQKLAVSKDSYSTLSRNFQIVKKNFEVMQEKLAKSDRQMNIGKAKISRMKEQLKQALSKKEEERRTVVQTNNRSSMGIVETSEMNRELYSLRDDIHELKSTIDRKDAELKVTQSKMFRLETLLKEEKQKFEEQKKATERWRHEAASQNEGKKKLIKTATYNKSSLEKEVEMLNEQLSESKKEINEIRDKAAEKMDKIRASYQKNISLQRVSLEKKCSLIEVEYAKKCSKAEGEKEKLEEQVKTLEVRISMQEKAYRKKEESLRKEIQRDVDTMRKDYDQKVYELRNEYGKKVRILQSEKTTSGGDEKLINSYNELLRTQKLHNEKEIKGLVEKHKIQIESLKDRLKQILNDSRRFQEALSKSQETVELTNQTCIANMEGVRREAAEKVEKMIIEKEKARSVELKFRVLCEEAEKRIKSIQASNQKDIISKDRAISDLEKKISDQKNVHKSRIEEIEQNHSQNIKVIINSHSELIEKLQSKSDLTEEKIRTKYENKLNELEKKKNKEIKKTEKLMQSQIDQLKSSMSHQMFQLLGHYKEEKKRLETPDPKKSSITLFRIGGSIASSSYLYWNGQKKFRFQKNRDLHLALRKHLGQKWIYSGDPLYIQIAFRTLEERVIRRLEGKKIILRIDSPNKKNFLRFKVGNDNWGWNNKSSTFIRKEGIKSLEEPGQYIFSVLFKEKSDEHKQLQKSPEEEEEEEGEKDMITILKTSVTICEQKILYVKFGGDDIPQNLLKSIMKQIGDNCHREGIISRFYDKKSDITEEGKSPAIYLHLDSQRASMGSLAREMMSQLVKKTSTQSAIYITLVKKEEIEDFISNFGKIRDQINEKNFPSVLFNGTGDEVYDDVFFPVDGGTVLKDMSCFKEQMNQLVGLVKEVHRRSGAEWVVCKSYLSVKKVYGDLWDTNRIKIPLTLNETSKKADFVKLLEGLRNHGVIFFSDQKTRDLEIRKAVEYALNEMRLEFEERKKEQIEEMNRLKVAHKHRGEVIKKLNEDLEFRKQTIDPLDKSPDVDTNVQDEPNELINQLLQRNTDLEGKLTQEMKKVEELMRKNEAFKNLADSKEDNSNAFKKLQNTEN